jgi:hypothetical protein
VEAVNPRWRKSSYSGNGGDCVEVGHAGDSLIAVRDTKDRSGTAHRYPPVAWRAFVTGIRRGEPGPDEAGRPL